MTESLGRCGSLVNILDRFPTRGYRRGVPVRGVRSAAFQAAVVLQDSIASASNPIVVACRVWTRALGKSRTVPPSQPRPLPSIRWITIILRSGAHTTRDCRGGD